MTRLQITAEQWQTMLAEVRGRASEESCGLLAGKDGRVAAVLPIPNALHSPVRFEMEPSEQVRAMLWIEEQGLELAGIYHSHLHGPSHPSQTDVAEFAYPGVISLIWSPSESGWQARAFAISNGNVLEVGVEVLAGSNDSSGKVF